MVQELAQRNYFESKTGEISPLQVAESLTQVQSYVWLDRTITRSEFYKILQDGDLGVWVDGPVMRYGFTISLTSFTPKIGEFLVRCNP